MSGTRVDAGETEAIWGITVLPTHAGCPPLGCISLTESSAGLPALVKQRLSKAAVKVRG